MSFQKRLSDFCPLKFVFAFLYDLKSDFCIFYMKIIWSLLNLKIFDPLPLETVAVWQLLHEDVSCICGCIYWHKLWL